MRARASSVTAAIVAIAVAALAAVIPTAVAAPAVRGSLQLSDSTVLPASPVTMTGSLPPRRSRTVTLQTKLAGTWRTLTSQKSSRVGAFSFTPTSPSTAGNRQYRVLAPAATLGGKRFAAVVTPTRTLTVVAVTAVDAGWRHACAVGSDRRAWCWGSNTYGELGDGQGATYDEANPLISGPVQVEGGNWADISTMGGSTCGLKRDDTAWCWGDHAGYTTGDTDGRTSAPYELEGAWRQIASGWFHVCGVRTDDTGWCWGLDNGQLGSDQPVAGKVQLPGKWLAVVPGGLGNQDDFSCGIKQDRSAWCWGANTSGQLGDGTTDRSAVPVEVAGDHEWAQLSAGAEHVCGVTTAGAGWCWGSNIAGRLGDGTVLDQHEPAQVTLAGTWSTIDAGFRHTCGVTAQAVAWCWGHNELGELGDGSTDTAWFPPLDPHQFSGTWRDMAAGHDFSTGAKNPGKPWAWGRRDHGQTGLGETEPAPATSPVAVPVNP